MESLCTQEKSSEIVEDNVNGLSSQKRRSKSLNPFKVDSSSKKRSSQSKIKKTTEVSLPSNIEVHVRVRPLLKDEILKSPIKHLKIADSKVISIEDDREFTFDIVYSEKSTTKEIFENSVKPNLLKSLQGYNFSVFVYGQTAAGKTFTMGTGYTQEKGLVQHSLEFIFSQIKENQSEYIIKASFIEIYNEDIKDLCNVKNKKNIVIRDSKETNSVNLIGVTELPVNDSQDALNLLTTGLMNRKTAYTLSNDTSSRSHAIYTLNIERVSEISSVFKINFIDLAGSERLKKSGAKGDRLKESVSINSGLLALSKVIMALANISKKSKLSEFSNSVIINNSSNLNMNLASSSQQPQNMNVHIPYRESKLTRILKDSLGGSSITLMIPCVSPSLLNTDETISTLNYASFAKSIKISPMIRQVYNDEESLRKENEELKKELEKYKNSKLEAENFKLKGIVKLLRKGNNNDILINTQSNELNLLGLDPKEIDHFLNLSYEEDKESISESNYDNPNKTLEDISQMYKRDSKINEDNKIIELEYSEKIKENIRLREDNEILKEEIKKFKLKEEDYENKLSFAAKLMNEPDKEQMYKKNKKTNNEQETKNSSSNRLSPVKYKNQPGSNLSNSTHKDQSHSQENKLRLPGNNLNKRLLNKSVDGIKHINKQNFNAGESQLNSINEKIKKLREFQNSLKRKLQETEIHKNKVIRNKNEEITYIKREVFERTKQLKNLEKLNERNNEIIEQSENTISVLKEDLRNKSLEISKIKQNNNNQTTNIITNNITTNIVTNVNSLSQNNENSFLNPNKTNEKQKARKERKKSQIISVNTSNNFNLSQESHADYYYQIKILIKQMEELIINKHKLEKRLNYIKKEKKDFLKLMDVNNEKIKNKLAALTKQRNDLNNLLMVDEKDKINLTHKYQVVLNKINSLDNRLEKMEFIKDSTLTDISTNEENLKSQISEITLEINKLKARISNYGEEKKKKQLSDLEISGDNEVTKEYKNIIREKEEKLVFIELDNIYKEKKIHELEKNLKEIVKKYEEEILKLKNQGESKIREFSKNPKIPDDQIDMENYQPEGISRSQSDFLLDEESMSKKQSNLPPKNTSSKENKSICVVKLKSTINELTSSPRRDERRGIPRALAKNKSFDNFLKKTK